MIQDTLNTTCSLIPVRDKKKKRTFGYYRRSIVRTFNQEKYHKRNKVKMTFSLLKRESSECLKARKSQLHIKEIKIKVTHYNLSRMILIFFVFNSH